MKKIFLYNLFIFVILIFLLITFLEFLNIKYAGNPIYLKVSLDIPIHLPIMLHIN